MTRFVSFLKNTLAGGILFLLPVAVIVIVLEKIWAIVHKLTDPLDDLLPDKFMGFDGRVLLVTLIIIAISFMAGIIFRSSKVKKSVAQLEESFLINILGYALYKTLMADALGEASEGTLHPVMFQDDDNWKMAFLVEENDRYCTLFCPEAPKMDSGEVLVVPASRVQKIAVHSTQFIRSLKSYGKGAINWLEKPMD